jgi:hypothetical protein
LSAAAASLILAGMAKRERTAKESTTSAPAPPSPGKPSALLDTRIIYCGDNLEQLARLPDACVDLIYIDPPLPPCPALQVQWQPWRETKAPLLRGLEDRHASAAAHGTRARLLFAER